MELIVTEFAGIADPFVELRGAVGNWLASLFADYGAVFYAALAI